MKPKGLILHKGEGFNGDRIVVIATLKSNNRKTGDMIQVWILPEDIKPTEAHKCGRDESVCGDCRHRLDGTCYVNVGQAPQQVWKSYHKGNYLDVRSDMDGIAHHFKNRKVRLGAWGEPVLIPLHIMNLIVDVSSGYTGYTHQWNKYSGYGKYLMASVDNLSESREAQSKGWRTFRVSKDYSNQQSDEVLCPADTHDVQCADCKLCNGSGVSKSVVIQVHGRGKNKFTEAMEVR